MKQMNRVFQQVYPAGINHSKKPLLRVIAIVLLKRALIVDIGMSYKNIFINGNDSLNFPLFNNIKQMFSLSRAENKISPL